MVICTVIFCVAFYTVWKLMEERNYILDLLKVSSYNISKCYKNNLLFTLTECWQKSCFSC